MFGGRGGGGGEREGLIDYDDSICTVCTDR